MFSSERKNTAERESWEGTYGSVHEQAESGHLQQRDRPQQLLPPQPQTDNPNTQRPTCIRQTPDRGTQIPRHAQPEPIEQTDRNRDGHSRPKHRRVVYHLVPTARQVEEWVVGWGRTVRKRGEGDERETDEDGERAEETFEANGDVGRNGVPGHDLLFDDELSSGANRKEYN